MPALRDISWAFESVTTDAGVTVPAPAYVENDILIAILMADTGSPTWTPPSGWTEVGKATNTSHLALFRKVATASEPATYTFASSNNETYNGAVISISDGDTTTPVNIHNFTNQASAAKFAMQQVTTTRDNCLLLFAFANSAVGVPSLIEGPVQGILGADGAAESLGIGWGFQSAQGSTPSTVTCSNIASGAGVKLVVAINPPSGGATVKPSYTAADLSVYVNPINGVTAYNGDTALAATADTGFSTTLGGLTAADAGVAAQADVGINSFHSVGRVTSISASQNLAGAELVLASGNRPNVTGKNVLVHLGPSTEGQLQRFSTIASGRGIWFGMRSAAASNWKIWQVYGSERGADRHQPVVINEGAGNTKSTNGTLGPSSIFAFGFWVSGTGVTTTIWDFASLWVLDTVTICGGLSASPVNIAGIVAAAATGHERRSVLRQGASQMLSYQPIQFGNGGTDPIYLDLDATAIEFPRQYNAATKEVTYNSTDNVAGLTYYAGASDTIMHRNSVVSSASAFHWRIHASSSASATYDFSGLQIIGAGDVVLRDLNTAFAFMTFARCGLVTANSAEIEDCAFTAPSGAVGVITAAPNKIKRCAFTSDGTGHGIEITAAGTYTFEGNTFTSYAGTNGSTGNEAIYNNSGGAVTLNITGGGSTPTIRNGAGASTTVNNSVVIELTGLIAGSRIYIENTTDTVVLFNEIEATTTFSEAVNFTANKNLLIRVRHASGATKYKPFETTGTLTAAGFALVVNQVVDQ